MPVVLFEVWGPIERTGAYSWIPVDKLTVESLDTDVLKEKALGILGKMKQKPVANAVRFELLHGNKKGTKITLTDVW